MTISIIAAMAENRVIGRDGAVPWRVPEDLRHFRDVTMGHPIIMGRKTFEQIGRPLPGRMNIVLTRQPDYEAPGCRVCHSLADALAACAGADEVFICGGGEVYRQTISLADRIYLTIIDGEFAGNTLFPDIPSRFAETRRREVGGDPTCVFILYEKKMP
ncbi:MAG TPA: dihydrofolate reductase [Geobacteraceae bacterium]